ncbi:hypothetical protein DFH06DRAFT_1332035 [Mycena polygramma]|nr:hypothetical protein DFH06DRAFT_1332035 [Mycena polygramma]
MKLVPPRPLKFSPYAPTLASRLRPRKEPTSQAARARPRSELDKWLAKNITSSSTELPEVVGPPQEEALCVVFMAVLKGATGGPVYGLSVMIEVRGCSSSPFVRLARFAGSKDQADAPLWTRIIQPGKSHYFYQPREFAARLVCGMTRIPAASALDDNISSKMCLWAQAISSGEPYEKDIDAQCQWILSPKNGGHK